MKEAVGGSMLLYIVVFFISIVMLFFVGIISYAKAYRTKNRIIEIIEKYEKLDLDNDNDQAVLEINSDLKKIGYSSINIDVKDCLDNSSDDSEYKKGDYAYCVSLKCIGNEDEHGVCDENGYYYKVKTFMLFEFPVIRDVLKLKVSGETKILGINYDYE